MSAAFYAATQTKRATRLEMDDRRRLIYQIVAEIKPCSVRQVFYQAEVRGAVEKSEAGYGKVQRILVELRRSGEMPFDWIADSTRWQRKPETYGSPAEAVESIAQFYRKNLWRDASDYVEVWLEKDALAAVIYPITSMYDVPLMVARGYASLSFLHSSAPRNRKHRSSRIHLSPRRL